MARPIMARPRLRLRTSIDSHRPDPSARYRGHPLKHGKSGDFDVPEQSGGPSAGLLWLLLSLPTDR